jgi:hypothetical protein
MQILRPQVASQEICFVEWRVFLPRQRGVYTLSYISYSISSQELVFPGKMKLMDVSISQA